MALEISYWGGAASGTGIENAAGRVISSESRTISGTSAQSGATPANARLVSIVATENARYEYSSADPTAAAGSAYIGSGERLWVEARPGFKIAGITAS